MSYSKILWIAAAAACTLVLGAAALQFAIFGERFFLLNYQQRWWTPAMLVFAIISSSTGSILYWRQDQRRLRRQL
jgi:hypothetical protein